jgi:hypothetical protein
VDSAIEIDILIVVLLIRLPCGLLILNDLNTSKESSERVYDPSLRRTVRHTLEAREGLTGYERTQYYSAAINAQQGLAELAQELYDDELSTWLSDIDKNSRWNCRFKSYGKA